jgi:hypothetical protein
MIFRIYQRYGEIYKLEFSIKVEKGDSSTYPRYNTDVFRKEHFEKLNENPAPTRVFNTIRNLSRA